MLQFQRVANTPLYVSYNVALSSANFAFLVTGQSSSLRNRVSLANLWADYQGVFLFFPSGLTENSIQDFVNAVSAALAPLPNAWFAWFASLDNLSAATYSISGSMTGQGSTRKLQTTNTALAIASNVTLNIPANNAVTPDPTWDGFVFTPQTTGSSLQFNSVQTVGIDGQINLPLTETNAGCFIFSIAPSVTTLNAIGTGIRYFYPTTDQLQALHYPVFASNLVDQVYLQVVLDLIAPLNPQRTALRFTANGMPFPIRSFFRTAIGQPIYLIPQSAAGLVFQVSADVPNTFYLTPQGDFALRVETTPSDSQIDYQTFLLCGLSGSEYIDFDTTSILTFVSGQPAQAMLNAEGMLAGTLTSGAQTAWCALRSTTDVLWYFAQPSDAVMYEPVSGQNYLQYLPLASDALPETIEPGQEAANSFPIVPYSGVTVPVPASYYQFEIQVLNPVRRNTVHRINVASSARPPTTSIRTAFSAQGLGLVISSDESQDWNVLTLAQSPAPELTAFSAPPSERAKRSLAAAAAPSQPVTSLQFVNVTGPLRDAFESNQVFLVTTSGSKFLQFCQLPSANSFFGVTIQNWAFNLDPAAWDSFGTILIFKKYGRSIRDLVNDVTTWSQPDQFNDDVLGVQQQLQAIIADIDARAAATVTHDYFTALSTMLSSTTWNGLLFLNVPIPIDGIPAELQGIAAGVDPMQFSARYITIQQTPVVGSGGSYRVGSSSSLSGLIAYENPTPFVPTSDYDFIVRSVYSLFTNSQITRFTSIISLMINRMFGDPAALLNTAGGTGIDLTGVYNQVSGVNIYTFTNTQSNFFQMSSKVLNRVTINRVQFSPTAISGTGSQTTIRTRFAMNGKLDFLAQPAFDAFSFGTNSTSTNGQLSISSLNLYMDFAAATPFYKTFTFDASQISVNANASVARSTSLYSHFPLRVTGLIQGTTGSTPQTLGYLPVDSPLGSDTLGAVWYALQFNLEMGSLGALASQAGFTANLLLAWSPDKDNLRAFIGLKIPGVSSGQSGLSLESLVQLTFGDIRFAVNGTNYILQMRNIAVKVLMLTFPPSGQTLLTLFGNPSNQTNTTLGWYAAYKK